jgi:hypothetical protein
MKSSTRLAFIVHRSSFIISSPRGTGAEARVGFRAAIISPSLHASRYNLASYIATDRE